MSVSKLHIIIDHRETKLKELFSTTSIPHTFENLVHADIQIIYQDKPLLLFERKTVSDLLSSVNDGRYRNQKAKLLESFERNQIYYILEGANTYHITPSKQQDKIVHGAIINTMIRDKLGFFHTKNIEETFQLLQCIWKRVSDDPEKYCLQDTQSETHMLQLPHTRVKDAAMCFKMQLCQVPDISIKSAEAIMQIYPTLVSFITSLAPKTREEKLNLLKNITTIDSKGKSRRISSRIIDNILEYIFQE